MSLQANIDFINKACEYVSFDSVHNDWIKFNTELPQNPEPSRPSYIKVWNENGSPWSPVKQNNWYDNLDETKDIRYSNGTNVTLWMGSDKKLVCNSGSTSFELFYEEISREEFVQYYKDMAYKGMEREGALEKIKKEEEQVKFMETREMKALQKFKEVAEENGLNVFAVALKGSQNYNLQDEESDVDANLIFIPTFRQLRKNEKFKFTTEDGDVTCHNIYSFAEIVAKGNPQWVEVCQTEFVIGDLSLFKDYVVNPSALKGMLMEKVHAFSKLYPSRKKYIEEFGYDPKQLHHIIRLYDSLKNNDPLFKYFGEDREHMLDIKRGRFPDSLEAAEKLRDEYVGKLEEVYEERKLNYEVQTVDFDVLDDLVQKSLCKGQK